MSTYDLYGSASEDLRGVNVLLERALGISSVEREGDFQGGIYYVFGDGAARSLTTEETDAAQAGAVALLAIRRPVGTECD
jgi:hypothetical protein